MPRSEISTRPDIELRELRTWLLDTHKVSVSQPMLWKVIGRMGQTLKKHLRAEEQDRKGEMLERLEALHTSIEADVQAAQDYVTEAESDTAKIAAAKQLQALPTVEKLLLRSLLIPEPSFLLEEYSQEGMKATMTKLSREELQPWRCFAGHHEKVVVTVEGHKRCTFCGFPMTAKTAVADVTNRLRRIGVIPQE